MTEKAPTAIYPEVPVVDPETIAEIDAIESDKEEDNRVPSRFAERIRVTVERVTTFLDRQAINKAHGQALRENFSRTQELQQEEEPSPSVDAIDDIPTDHSEDAEEGPEVEEAETTATEAKDTSTKDKERKKRTKTVLKRIGMFAVKKLEANGFIPAIGTWHKRGGISGRIAKAYVARKNKRERVERISASSSGGHETAPHIPPAETEEEPAKDEDEELLLPEPETDPVAEKARERAAENARKAEERRADRKERTPIRERPTSLWQKLMGGRRKIGTKALAFAARLRASAGAAGAAWKNFDQ